MLTANEIRQQFIDFFVKKHGHTFVPSSSVVPLDDPTLLFTNAGMNQFKDVFLGTGTRPYKRAVDTQKCIRAGGKHNDLDDVGKDTYHHTFFEMLGNWSFGDYFKKEAIALGVGAADRGLGPGQEPAARDRLRGRRRARGWRPTTRRRAVADRRPTSIPTHIHKGNKKDNFWEMGETGPCGPCTEIHIDRTPDKSGGKLVNAGPPEVIEIWNLVFIQFNRGAGQEADAAAGEARRYRHGLRARHGGAAGQGEQLRHRRVHADLRGDPRRSRSARHTRGKLDDLKDTAYRVIADHIRTLTFALTDGAVPEQRGARLCPAPHPAPGGALRLAVPRHAPSRSCASWCRPWSR